MVSAPYERKNKKTENIAVRAVKAYISKSILPTYGRFSRGRSQIYKYINIYTRNLKFAQLVTELASLAIIYNAGELGNDAK